MSSKSPSVGQKCWAAGWGNREFDATGEHVPDELRSVDLDIFSEDDCHEAYGANKARYAYFKDEQICSGKIYSFNGQSLSS